MVAGTCLGSELGRRTTMNRIKRMREGDGVPASASDSGGAGVSGVASLRRTAAAVLEI
jgi:hypothetical protein